MKKFKIFVGCITMLVLAGCVFVIYPGLRLDRVAVQCDYSSAAGIEQCKILVVEDDEHKGESWEVEWESFSKPLKRYIHSDQASCHTDKQFIIASVVFNPKTKKLVELTLSHCEKR